jgi:capsular exopolysaccharide synthesis family protein
MTRRNDPGLADHARSLWRRKLVVVLGLLAGLALGTYVLPKVASPPQYRATVRVDLKPLASTLLGPANASGGTATARTPGAQPASLLQDVNVSTTVLKELGAKAPRLDAGANTPAPQRPGALAAAIVPSPVPDSSQFDLSYTDHDPKLAALAIQKYADAFARRRNADDAALTRRAVAAMQRELDQTNAKIAELSARADRETDPILHRSPSTATSTRLRLATEQWRAQSSAIDNVRRQLLFLGPRTTVVAAPVVVRADQPIGRALYLLVGLLLGAVAGIGLALLVEAARPKVVTPRDLEASTRLEPVGTVPRSGVRRRRRLAVAAAPFSPAAEGYRRVAAELRRRGLGQEIKMLAVVSPDRSEGRSTLTANLAYALASQGRPVAVICGDMRRAGAEQIFRMPRGNGLAEFLEGDDRDPVTKLWSVTNSLVVIPAGIPTRNPAELLATTRLRTFMTSMRELEWLILIDTPPARSLADAHLLAATADAVLLVAHSRFSRARSLEALTAALDRANHRVLGAALVGATTGMLAGRELRRSGRGHQPERYPTPREPAADERVAVPAWQDDESESEVLGASTSKDRPV